MQATLVESAGEICRHVSGAMTTVHWTTEWVDHMFVIKALALWSMFLMTVMMFMIMCRVTKKKVTKIELEVRTVATQSMVTYKRKYQTPRFMVLGEDLQGAFTTGTLDRP